jgi:predicted metal-dependent HD superfamily phosphohydrolase
MSTLEGWLRSWTELGVPTSARLQDLFAELASRYAEPHRFYHTGQHLAECFERWSELRERARHPAEVEVALWFHDAVYDTHSDSNESRSADLALDATQSLGVDAMSAQRIYDLILITRHAMMPVGQDAPLIVDTDLAILGAESVRFVEYEHQVRKEYAWVPENVFRERRAKVLRGFLERPYIFSTDLFRARYESRARENIRQSLAALR